MPPKPDDNAEVRGWSDRTDPDCDHERGPVVPGRYAAWVCRCRKCGGVATVRACPAGRE